MRDESYEDITEIIINTQEMDDDIRIAEPVTPTEDDEEIAEDIIEDIKIAEPVMPTVIVDDSDEFIDKIGESIAKQIEDDIPQINIMDTEPGYIDAEENDSGRNVKWYERYPKWVIPSALGGIILVIICLIVFAVPAIRNAFIDEIADGAADKMTYEPLATQTVTEPPQATLEPVQISVTPEPTISEVPTPEAITITTRHEDYSINILLVGEENIGAASGRGNTDLLIIATINTKTNSFSLTSIMRDFLVDIPGHGDYKINRAYQLGGMELLFETIESNFYISLDGYMKIDFSSFEKVIDLFGGIEMELTEAEAGYLNASNYISDESSRNVKTGLNTLNGSQALGYCRIRAVGTDSFEYNDFGRTTRQKRVLQALMDKCKSMNYVDLLIAMNECLPMITTDIDGSMLSSYIKAAYGIGFGTPISTYRIPVADSYQEVKLRGENVLMSDMETNIRELHVFVFGDYSGDVIPTEGPSVTLLAVPTQQP